MNGDPEIPSPSISLIGENEFYVCVLLGASNLARGYSALAYYLTRNLKPEAVKIYAACGPGRGYGCWGGMFNISYPPIAESPLFERLGKQARDGKRVVALITDIGNDLLYGMDGDSLIATMKNLFERLENLNAEIYATTLPVYFEGNVPAIVYYPIRTFLYPKSHISREEAIDGVRRVNAFLKEYKSPHIHLIPPLDDYLGWDHVHFGLVRSAEVWNRIGECLLDGFGRRPHRPIRFPRILLSYKDCFIRLVFMEMFKCIRRSKNLF
ncbi:hypothetical protein ACTRW9_03385 [Nitrospina sp. 32_T5]|uniref:hypothetical protein n=1 Tax=unclassified Nitrospina TaxID=2638683 RepID=UPI003F9B0F8A